eukprot:UN06958
MICSSLYIYLYLFSLNLICLCFLPYVQNTIILDKG